jgi:hypothetical protein
LQAELVSFLKKWNTIFIQKCDSQIVFFRLLYLAAIFSKSEQSEPSFQGKQLAVLITNDKIQVLNKF